MVKTLIFTVSTEQSKRLIAVCVRGDLDVNEIKLSNLVRGPVTPAGARKSRLPPARRSGSLDRSV